MKTIKYTIYYRIGSGHTRYLTSWESNNDNISEEYDKFIKEQKEILESISNKSSLKQLYISDGRSACGFSNMKESVYRFKCNKPNPFNLTKTKKGKNKH